MCRQPQRSVKSTAPLGLEAKPRVFLEDATRVTVLPALKIDHRCDLASFVMHALEESLWGDGIQRKHNANKGYTQYFSLHKIIYCVGLVC